MPNNPYPADSRPPFPEPENTSPASEGGPKGVRLNKALADAGFCSRRHADMLIFSGALTLNGKPATNPALRVMPGDVLTVHGEVVSLVAHQPCCLMLNKPVAVVSTVSDPQGRPTVLDFVPPAWRGRRLYPVGRLDFFSEGLLILTDDGALAHRLMHPRYHLPRIYRVLVRENPSDEALETMRRGMTLAEGENLAPVQVRRLSPQADGFWLEMTLSQGLNRQIRRMCRDLGQTILRLVRVSQGPLRLGKLAPGTARELTGDELAALHKAAGLA